MLTEASMLASIPFPSWIRPEVIPGLPIRWYGLMYLVAFAVTYLLFMVQLKQRGLAVKRDHVLDMFFWAIIGLLVGARAAAVTIYDPSGYYLRHPLQIILPFAMVALIFRARRFPTIVWLYLGGFALSIVAVFVTDRYRAPMIPVLLIAAAVGAGTVVHWLRGRDWKRLSAAVGCLAATALLATLPGSQGEAGRPGEGGGERPVQAAGGGHGASGSGTTAHMPRRGWTSRIRVRCREWDSRR